MSVPTLRPVASEGETCAPCTHSLQLYGSDERLLAVNAGQYINNGLLRGDGVVVIATPAHASAFVSQIQLLAADVDRAFEERQLVILDAEKTLDRFVVNGQPDETLFQNTIGAALRGVGGIGKRAYGEMVGILWARGAHAAAIRLEEMWNKLLPAARLRLFCAYPVDIFAREFQSPAVEKILESHTHVFPTCEDGILETAIQRAMLDILPAQSGKRFEDVASGPEHAALPTAERVILGLKRDIPEHAQEVLIQARRYYQSEKRFRALIENSSDAILLINPQGRILYASPSTARVLGYAPGKVAGRNCLDLIHQDDREHAGGTLVRAHLNSGQPIRFEARVQTGAEGWIWMESTITDLTEEPSVGGIVWNYRDITDRKAAERALRESECRLKDRERYLQALLDSVPECITVLGRNGEVLEMNAAGLRMLAAESIEQVLGKSIYSLIDLHDRAAFQSLNDNVFRGGVGGSLEFSITGFKGGLRTFETHVVALRDEADRVTGALSAMRDVTERKVAEAALRNAKDGLEQFAYAAAHDLQEPIRNVALFTELLAQDYGDKLDERANEFIGITIEGARRMEALVKDLLSYARSLDKPHEEPVDTNANEVIAEVLDNLRTAISTVGAEVACADLPTMPIHRAHLLQLFQNLVGNALKYKSERPPRIEISAVKKADEFVVTVRDNGVGIPANQRERIFGVFKRLHGRSVPGNGIGLAICRRIISHYEGRIWVESNEREGSAFVFTLPCLRH
jgi:PAS domain S-box-containing protein